MLGRPCVRGSRDLIDRSRVVLVEWPVRARASAGLWSVPVTVLLRDLTTMRVGGPTREFARASETDELVELVAGADVAKTPVLILGGGSNLVVGDAGWDGVTVQVATSGVEIDGETVRAAAGVDWDYLVRTTLAEGLAGFE